MRKEFARWQHQSRKRTSIDVILFMFLLLISKACFVNKIVCVAIFHAEAYKYIHLSQTELKAVDRFFEMVRIDLIN